MKTKLTLLLVLLSLNVFPQFQKEYEYGAVFKGKVNILDFLDIKNKTTNTEGALGVANFAGQVNYGNEPIGVVFHNYTNATNVQIDNVGENNSILVLKNARNPGRRPDKATDFFGTGNFLRLLRQETSNPSDVLMTIAKDASFVYGKASSTEFASDRDNTGYGFTFTHYKHFTYPFALKTAGQYIFEFVDSGGRLTLRSTENRNNGIRLQASLGNVDIVAGGKILAHFNSNGKVGIGEGIVNPSEALEVSGNIKATKFILSDLNTAPENSNSLGVKGEIRITSEYIYICTSTNTWVRSELVTW